MTLHGTKRNVKEKGGGWSKVCMCVCERERNRELKECAWDGWNEKPDAIIPQNIPPLFSLPLFFSSKTTNPNFQTPHNQKR